MRPLRTGQETVLSWATGSVECHVVAAAGQFILLRPFRGSGDHAGLRSDCSLTYLDGMVPMGWDGSVEPGGHPGELRFRVRDGEMGADRRSSVRIPLIAPVRVVLPGQVVDGQLLDVSAGGLRLRNPGRIPTGTMVRVRSVVTEDVVVDADGVVRTSEPGVTSVEFTQMHGIDRETLGAWTIAVLRAGLNGQG